MPYVDEEARRRLRYELEAPENPGELNYLITLLLISYIQEQGKVSYQTINDIIGALEGAKLEFYRRVANVYEDFKIDQNGDVYEGILAGLLMQATAELKYAHEASMEWDS